MPKLPLLLLLLLALLPAAAVADEAEDEPPGTAPPPRLAPAPRRPAEPAEPAADASGEPKPWYVVSVLGHDVAPGDKQRLFLRASESFAGTSVELPVLVVRGLEAGPTLCLTAGVHGDELNGIEIVRKLFEQLTPGGVSGMLMALPVANLHGFRRSSRYLPDRRDLNRYFPGHAGGSSASRIANAIFDSIIRRCDALVDFHTGSFHRTNLPQLRADLGDERMLAMARGFGVGVVIHSEGGPGTLRRAAADVGIPAITYEAGEPMRFQLEEIDRGVEGTRNLMIQLGMLRGKRRAETADGLYYRSRWVRVNDGGIFLTDQRLGNRVEVGAELGTVTDPVSNERARILSPLSGRIIGMALSQVVIPGFAAFHIGIESEARPAPAPVPVPVPVPEVAPPAAPVAEPTPDQLDAEEHPE